MVTVDVDQLIARVARAFEQDVLPCLADYTAIRCLSPSFDPSWQEFGAIAEAAELLAGWARAQPLAASTVEVLTESDKTPVIFAEIAATDPAPDTPTTLIYGHLDKQPPIGEWREGLDAFTAVREGDRLYGRGTADDGYALFAAFTAVSTLEQMGIAHGRVVVLIEASEESGSPDLETYLDRLAREIGSPALVVCLDSGCLSYDRLWTTTSLRGNLIGVLRVDVTTEATHSGQAGGIVPSSFRIARELLSRVEDPLTGELLVDELTAEVPPHRRAEIEVVARELGERAAGLFPTIAGLELSGTDVVERILNGTWRASLSVTGVDGVPSVRDGGNVLRPFTALKLSFRLPPTVDPVRAGEALAALLTADPPSRAKVSFVVDHPAEGWDAPAPARWLQRALDEASLAYFGAPTGALGLGGSIPFMASLGRRYRAAQFIATGVLGPESNAHGPNEFLHLPTARAITATIAHLVASVPS